MLAFIDHQSKKLESRINFECSLFFMISQNICSNNDKHIVVIAFTLITMIAKIATWEATMTIAMMTMSVKNGVNESNRVMIPKIITKIAAARETPAIVIVVSTEKNLVVAMVVKLTSH